MVTIARKQFQVEVFQCLTGFIVETLFCLTQKHYKL